MTKYFILDTTVPKDMDMKSIATAGYMFGTDDRNFGRSYSIKNTNYLYAVGYTLGLNGVDVAIADKIIDDMLEAYQ
jgi:hypothetical protein